MIKTIYFVFFICAFSLGLWACTGKDSDKFKNLSSDQFEEMIQDKTIQLVDVRTVAEYSEGHKTQPQCRQHSGKKKDSRCIIWIRVSWTGRN